MKIANWWNNYTSNIKRTMRHKVAYTIDEYKQFGYNTTDCLTHDSEKLLEYMVGMPRCVVSRRHRAHSEHHFESNKPKNIKSMFIDIHCSAEKSDKPLPFRDYFYKSKELQMVEGLEEFSKKRNFGELVPIETLREEVSKVTGSFKEFVKFGYNVIKRMKLK